MSDDEILETNDAGDILGSDPFDSGDDDVDSIWNAPKKKRKKKKTAPEPHSEPADFAPPPAPKHAPQQPAAEKKSGPQGDTWEPISDATVAELSVGSGSPLDETIWESSVADHTEKERERMIQEEMIQLVGFRVGEELFGIDILIIQEIIRLQPITVVPRTQKYILGVVNLRGKVIPVVSLQRRLSFEPTELTPSARIIFVQLGQGTIGFLVDAVTEVIRIPKRLIEPPPPTTEKFDMEFIQGVGRLGNSAFVLLDLNRVISSGGIKTEAAANA